MAKKFKRTRCPTFIIPADSSLIGVDALVKYDAAVEALRVARAAVGMLVPFHHEDLGAYSHQLYHDLENAIKVYRDVLGQVGHIGTARGLWEGGV